MNATWFRRSTWLQAVLQLLSEPYSSKSPHQVSAFSVLECVAEECYACCRDRRARDWGVAVKELKLDDHKPETI